MTIAQLIESEQGTEFIEAMDNLVSNVNGLGPTPSVAEFHTVLDKFVHRLNQLGLEVPETLPMPA